MKSTYDLNHIGFVDLIEPDTVLQMFVTNVRNRPLTVINIDSLTKSVLSLYHNLLTGRRDYPLIEARVGMGLMFESTLHETMKQPNWENAPPPGPLPPAPGVPVRKIYTPAIPETADMEVLRGDRRNCVRTMEYRDESTYTRVISPVYRPQDTELTNRWRVTDYDSSGELVMSALCRFKRCSVRLANSKRRREEECSSTASSTSPPKKRARV
ncbi:uncharacterized protein LOC124995821 [Mugil cephalus]|uniref:uncharacterized protein LOC124995821 n=1 Tax=Mugil cephalus TaxID=48193 RepID=UPI001FB68BE1|nr:uncharacterized protein LOC124995821 [Mugil cephalus]